MQSLSRRAAFAAALSLALAAGLAPACKNPRHTPDPDRPGPIRLSSRPPGARVRFEGANLVLYTPCELPIDTPPKVQLEISMEGFKTFVGTIHDMQTTAANNYEITLERIPGS